MSPRSKTAKSVRSRTAEPCEWRPKCGLATSIGGPASRYSVSLAYCSVRSCGSKPRSEEHTSELQSRFDLVCRLLLEKKKNKPTNGNHLHQAQNADKTL